MSHHKIPVAQSSYIPKALAILPYENPKYYQVKAMVNTPEGWWPVVAHDTWSTLYLVDPVSGEPVASDFYVDSLVYRVNHCFSSISRAIRQPYIGPALNPFPHYNVVDWQSREEQRMDDGTYTRLPDIPELRGIRFNPNHFVHLSMSKQTDDYIAYTPSNEYGLQDRQVRIRLGRYLKKYKANLYTDKEIAKISQALITKLERDQMPYVLNFTTEVETINQIFETPMYARCSSCLSCMYNKFTTWTHRPYHVYANSPDVAVAYLTQGDAIVARTVVSTKYDKWIRTYSIEQGDVRLCSILEKMLEEEGYSEGSLSGSRLSKLPSTDDPILPYLDCGDLGVCETWRGDWMVVEEGDDDMEYMCHLTSGYGEEVTGNDDDDYED